MANLAKAHKRLKQGHGKQGLTKPANTKPAKKSTKTVPKKKTANPNKPKKIATIPGKSTKEKRQKLKEKHAKAVKRAKGKK